MDEVAPNEPLDDDYGFLRLMIESLLVLESVPPDQRISVFQTVAPRLNQARLAYAPFRQEPARQRFYRRVLRRMAACRGGVVGWLWYVYWRVRSAF